MTDLRKLARDQECLIRVPNICTHDSSTVVGCHYRLSSGMGRKPSDLALAHGCFACHQFVDTHHDTESRLMHAEGVIRTLNKLEALGYSLRLDSGSKQ